MKSVVVDGVLTNEIVLPIPQDDGKANVIPTFIKTRPLVVGGNSRGRHGYAKPVLWFENCGKPG